MKGSPKIQSPYICHLFGLFDQFRHFEFQFGQIEQVSRHLDQFGPFKKIRIPAEELSQLFCRINRKFKVLIFAIYWVDTIDIFASLFRCTFVSAIFHSSREILD